MSKYKVSINYSEWEGGLKLNISVAQEELYCSDWFNHQDKACKTWLIASAAMQLKEMEKRAYVLLFISETS